MNLRLRTPINREQVADCGLNGSAPAGKCSGDATSPKCGCAAFGAFFHTLGVTGDEASSSRSLRRGVAVTEVQP